MSTLLPFAHAWMWLGLAVSTSAPVTPATPATPVSSHSEPVAVRGTYGNHGLWLSSAGMDATAQRLLTDLGNEPRVEKADYVVVDLRGDNAVLAQASPSVIDHLWGQTAAPSSKRRLKANAHAYVIVDGNCSGACEHAVALWKTRGAIRLDVPGTLAGQDEIALEAWVLAAANHPPAPSRATAQAASSP